MSIRNKKKRSERRGTEDKAEVEMDLARLFSGTAGWKFPATPIGVSSNNITAIGQRPPSTAEDTRLKELRTGYS
jgi:hypothetical protein